MHVETNLEAETGPTPTNIDVDVDMEKVQNADVADGYGIMRRHRNRGAGTCLMQHRKQRNQKNKMAKQSRRRNRCGK